MFARLAAWVDRRAALVALAWVGAAVVLTVTVPSLASLGTDDRSDVLPPSAPSRQADRVLREAFPNDPALDPALLVFVRSAGLAGADRDYIAGLTSFLTSAEASEHITAVQSAATAPELAPVLRSPDGKAELVIVALQASTFTEGGNRAVAFLRHHLDATAPAGLEHHVTGSAALSADQRDALLQSFENTALATVVLVLVILLLVYRSAVAPLISLATIGTAFLVARGVVSLLAQRGVKVASIAETFMVLMAFGAGTDYCLFVISRYREESGGGVERAGLARATTAVGPVITASAATVILGFLAFVATDLGTFRSMGPAMGLAIAFTLLAGLTLTPALLRLTGRGAFWPARHFATRARPAPRWERLAATVTRRPGAVLLAGILFLAVPASGLLTARQSFDIVSELPPGAPARRGFEALAGHYPAGTLAPVYLVVAADTPLDDGGMAAVDRLTESLRALPEVAEVRSVTQPAGAPLTLATLSRLTGGTADLRSAGIDPDRVDITPLYNALASPRGLRFDAGLLRAYPQLRERLGFFLGAGDRSTRLVVSLAGNPYSRKALGVVRQVDDMAASVLAGSPLAGSRLAVAGPSAFFVDVSDIGSHDFRTVAALVIAGILVILGLLLRSPVAPLYLLASVLLSFAATMGLSVVLFQAVFDQPGISFYLPTMLFVILVALGADYNIFITGRIREELDAGVEVTEAVRRGLVITGRVITSAGLILAGTFSALMLASIPSLRMVGFAVAAGVLIDTVIVRSLLVPATAVLLGPLAFWPAGGRAVSPARHRAGLGLAGAAGAAVVVALIVLLATGGATPPILRVTTGAGETAAGATPAAAATATTSSSTSPAPTLRAGETAAPTTPPTTRAATSATTRPPASVPATTATSGPAVAASPPLAGRPAGVAVPAFGAWRYHRQGTRKIGQAGSTQPFSEDVVTQVSRAGGSDQAPEILLATESGGGSSEERRRYRSSAVDLLALRQGSGAVTFGGTFQPPQLLLRWPVEVGATWTSDWTAEGTQGHNVARVVGERQVTVAGRAYRCVIVEYDSRFTGDAQGRRQGRSCWVAELGMSVEDDEQIQATYRGVRFEGTSHSTLISPP
jgi:putative drug exporter of the RND superfamily